MEESMIFGKLKGQHYKTDVFEEQINKDIKRTVNVAPSQPPHHTKPARLCGRWLNGECVKGTVEKHKAVPFKFSYLNQCSVWKSLRDVSYLSFSCNGIQFNLFLKLFFMPEEIILHTKTSKQCRELKSGKSKFSSIKLNRQHILERVYGEVIYILPACIIVIGLLTGGHQICEVVRMKRYTWIF